MAEVLGAAEVVDEALRVHGAVGERTPRLPSGFPCIDDRIGGLTAGELTILGARPNIGKSTALLYVARTMELAGFTPGIVSLEDSPVTVGERIQSFYTNIAALELRLRGEKYRKDKRIESLRSVVESSKLRFTFPIGGTLPETLDCCDRLIGDGCQALLVDYLTAIDVGSKDLRGGYSTAVTKLKRASATLGVPLVLAAQLRRPQWSGKEEAYVDEPELHDLGETSFVERRAEIVVLFWRDKEGVTMGKVAKFKYGKHLPRFAVYHDPHTGLLRTEESDAM